MHLALLPETMLPCTLTPCLFLCCVFVFFLNDEKTTTIPSSITSIPAQRRCFLSSQSVYMSERGSQLLHGMQVIPC